MTVVPFQDFRAPYQELRDDLDAAYRRFMESGCYVLGGEVAEFEEEYAAYCEAKHCVGVGHGLDALRLALLASGIGPGDEVIVPSNTYIATWLAVTQTGANPAPVEPNTATFNIDVERIEAVISPKTRAIIPVNLYGHPCDYDPICSLASRHGLKVIVDNAQAQGARYKGRRVGGIARVECHSFYPSKNLGAFGEAGAVTTNDREIADRVRVLRNYGSRIRYYNEVAGFNSRLDALQAALLRVKLARLDEWNARRKEAALRYLTSLSQCPDLVLPSVADWADHVWHLFVIRHPRRDELQKHLTELGVQTLIHYPIPPHLSGAYVRSSSPSLKCAIAERLADEVLSLPIGPHISISAQNRVISAVDSYCSLSAAQRIPRRIAAVQL